MTTAASAIYAIRVDGHLGNHWSHRLGGLTITHNGDGTTTLIGAITDQAHLHGVLAGIRDIGATLIELRGSDQSGCTASTTEPAPVIPPVLMRPRRTQRLTLRAGTVADADATWTFRQCIAADAWLTGSPADLDGYRRLFADPARLATTIIIQLGHTPNATVIGDLMVRRHDAPAGRGMTDRARGAQAELSWVLDPSHGGRGYATEAVRDILRYCFTYLGVHRVTTTRPLGNTTDILMERVGMRRETHAVRASLHRSGPWRDTMGYSTLAGEWPGS